MLFVSLNKISNRFSKQTNPVQTYIAFRCGMVNLLVIFTLRIFEESFQDNEKFQTKTSTKAQSEVVASIETQN